MPTIHARLHGAFVLAAVLILPPCAAAATAPAHPDLIPSIGVAQPSGWSDFVVPRHAPDATASGAVTAPDTLRHGVPTWFNYAVGGNSALCATWTDKLVLAPLFANGATLDSSQASLCAHASATYQHLNVGPYVVRGGRHTLSEYADIWWTSGADYDFRNPYACSTWVWSPEPLPAGVVTTSAEPPPARPDNVGYQLNRTSPYAFVLSGVSDNATDNLLLNFYTDAWTGSTTGYQVEGVGSAMGLGQVNFVVGVGGPSTVYPAVCAVGGNATGGYSLGWAEAAGRRDSLGNGRWPGALAPMSMATVYEVWMTAGVPFRAGLSRTSGADHLALATGPPQGLAGTNWSRYLADGNSQPSGTDSDSLSYTPWFTGWHAVAVYRTGAEDRAHAQSYLLQLGDTTASVDGGMARLFLAPPEPNPVSGPARLAFGLPRAGHARLEVFDAQGRQVRTLADGALPAGPQDARWDLRDAHGAAVPNGLYWARLQVASQRLTTRLVVLR